MPSQSGPVPLFAGATVGHQRPLITGVNLHLEPGTVTRLVGKNGVGKSTLIETALRLRRPLEGEQSLPWRPGAAEYQRCVGYVPSTVGIYPNIRLRQWVKILSQGFELGEQAVWDRWEHLGGRGEFETPLAALSSGNRKKALFLAAVVHQRRLLVADEPFEEVDLEGRQRMAENLLEQRDCGAALLLVSHQDPSGLVAVDRTLTIADGHLVEAPSVP